MYYEVAIRNRPLTLTYTSTKSLSPGQICLVPLAKRRVEAVVLYEVDKPEFDCYEIEEISEHYFSPMQFDFAKFISQYYVAHISEALSLFVPFKKNVSLANNSELNLPPCKLSPKQLEALAFIQKHPVSLLFGQTGSGKTEIYIEYFKKIIQEGKEAIFLMPEIALTPQMQKRLEEVFGKSVVVWHSKLTKKKRQENLEKIYRKEAKIIAGPRSALFLPLQNLGLIVVDEEHDESYKAQSRPHINAKDIAVYMGKKLKIPVVLGSATPSVTSYYRYPSFELSRFKEAKKEFIFDNGRGISETILQNLKTVLENNKQALIFLPTRAHFKYLVCQECGEAVKCPYCDVGMSLHFDKNALVCHYCEFSEPILQQCPKCRSENLSAKRLGTAEVVNELKLLLPDAKIAQFDRDTITTQRKLESTLKAFAKKEIDILVGTQMLSKGHDYPDVALSVIMDIDYVLAQADYKARERAIALLLQIAGRAGRQSDARVIVQTKNRDFFASYLDYKKFLVDEIKLRKDRYPPFVRLAQLNFAHKSKKKAAEAMQEVLVRLQKFEEVEIVGSGPNIIEKIANKYRYHILLRSKSTKKLLEAIYASRNELCDVDMDPVQIG
ncbi:primosomal protein N' [Nitratiruptor sp. YY09-18]|nr:primosomal protein N' [Nitratiruptor sp. YY09-18]